MTATPLMGKKKVLRLFFSLLFSAGLLFFALRNVNFGEANRAILRADPFFLICAVACSLMVNVVLASWQWQIFLGYLGLPLSFAEHAFMKVSLYPLRLVFPSKSGDLTRALYLKSRHGFSGSLGVSSTLFIVGANTGVLLLLAFTGSLLGGTNTRAITIFTGVGVVVGLLALFLIRLLLSRIHVSTSSSKVKKIAGQLEVLAKLPLHRVFIVTAVGMIALLVHIFTFYFIARSAGMDIPVTVALAYAPLIFIAGNLPGTVMGIGARETATVTLLAGFADSETLLVCGVLLTAIDKLLSVTIGTFFFPRFMRYSLSKPEENQTE